MISLNNLSEEQARVVQDALDMYSRVLGLQLEEVAFHLYANHPNIKYGEMQDELRDLKSKYFPEHSRHSYIGISAAPENAKIAYDLLCVIRHDISWHKNPEGGQTVNFYTPLKVSKQNLITTTIAEEKCR